VGGLSWIQISSLTVKRTRSIGEREARYDFQITPRMALISAVSDD
jgi:hypothetical protein